MNDVKALVEKFESQGIHLFSEAGKLRYKAAKELMNPEVLAELKAHKVALMDFFESQKKDSTFVIDRTNRFEPFPLTDVQSAYLLGRKKTFEYGGVACHVYLEIRYTELEPSKVRSIWNAIVRKYDMLHAIVYESGFQQVMKDVPDLEIPEWDLIKNPEKKKAFEEFRKEMGSRSYTVGKWPMFGLAVSKNTDGAILHFSIEFLLVDWTSIWKLVAEFEAAYFDGVQVLGEEGLSFRDYLIAEKKIKSSVQYEKEKKYWMDRVANLPEAPELPKLSTADAKDSFSRKFLRFSPESWNRLKSRAKQYGLTPTVPILSSYADVLAKWSRNKHFCINMTVLNRLPLHENVMDIVGDFTSLNLLEIDCRSKENFLSRTRKINSQLFSDLDNRLFSGVEVMREISRQSKKTGISMPIVYTSAVGLAESGTPLRGNFVGGISQTPQTFIDCQVMDGDFGLQVNWDYRDGVFPQGLLEAMFESFEKRLQNLAANESDWENISEISIPEKDVAERIAANHTQKKWKIRLLQDDFIQSVKRTPKKIAIDDGNIQFTFEELDSHAKILAQKLMDCGVKHQDCVPVLMEKSVWQVVSVLGILYAGAIYVPIAANKAKGRAEKIVKKTGAKVALGVSTDKTILNGELTTLTVDTLFNDSLTVDTSKFPQSSPKDIAYIIYTSGSTGEPKGVVISHSGAMNTIDDMNDRFGVSSKDATLGLSQLNFDLSVYDLFGILACGGTLIYPKAKDYMNPEAWVSLIRKHHITVWNTVPALMKMLLDFVERDESAEPLPLKEVFLSGDWIPVNMPDRIRNAAPGVDVICLGGATEASIWSNYHRYDPNDGLKILPYGRPLANQTMHILDSELNDCPTMVAGQIALGGDGVALGYYLDSERTAAQFVNLPITGEHVYLTGDMGRYLPGGEIEFLGREDSQVKIRGHRIELGEIENVFKEHPQIREAVAVVNDEKSEINVMLQPDPYGAKKEGALSESNLFVKQNDNAKVVIDKKALKEFMDKYLLHYMQPSHIELTDKFPLSANGKIDRKAIRQFFACKKEEAKSSSSIQEISPIEKEILSIWAKALNEPNLQTDSNFYDYGADSLMMAQVTTTLRNQICPNVAFDTLLKEMLENPTVSDIHKLLSSQNNDSDFAESNSDKILRIHRFGKSQKDKIRVLLPAIFWNLDKFHDLIPLLEAQDEGEIITFTMKNAKAFNKLHPAEVGTKLAELFTEAVLASNAHEIQIIAYCYISPVAIEMAERLLEKGILVKDLTLIDGSRMGMRVETSFIRKIFFAQMLFVDLAKWGLDVEEFVVLFQNTMQKHSSALKDDDLIAVANQMHHGDKVKELLFLNDDDMLKIYQQYSQNFGKTADFTTIKRLYQLFNQSMNVMLNYTPASYFGDIRYLKADNKDGIFRYFDLLYHEWDELCIGDLNVCPIPGNHFSCLSDPKFVKVLAQNLSWQKQV